MKAFMYILSCGNGALLYGSTKNLELRLEQHQLGEGSRFTRKYLPIKLAYFEEFDRIDEAFVEREKQIQKWSHAKKEALINKDLTKLKKLGKRHSVPSTSGEK